MTEEENEIKYVVYSDKKLGVIIIKRYYHSNLFLKLWRLKSISSFIYIRDDTLYIKVNVGAGGLGREGKLFSGDVVYNSAEDAIGIVLKDRKLKIEETVIGKYEGNLESLKSMTRKSVSLKRL